MDLSFAGLQAAGVPDEGRSSVLELFRHGSSSEAADVATRGCPFRNLLKRGTRSAPVFRR
jgi:hypothetical protein